MQAGLETQPDHIVVLHLACVLRVPAAAVLLFRAAQDTKRSDCRHQPSSPAEQCDSRIWCATPASRLLTTAVTPLYESSKENWLRHFRCHCSTEHGRLPADREDISPDDEHCRRCEGLASHRAFSLAVQVRQAYASCCKPVPTVMLSVALITTCHILSVVLQVTGFAAQSWRLSVGVPFSVRLQCTEAQGNAKGKGGSCSFCARSARDRTAH